MTTLQTPPSKVIGPDATDTPDAAEEPKGDTPSASNDSSVDNMLSFLGAVGERMLSAYDQHLSAERERALAMAGVGEAIGTEILSAYDQPLVAELDRARSMAGVGEAIGDAAKPVGTFLANFVRGVAVPVVTSPDRTGAVGLVVEAAVRAPETTKALVDIGKAHQDKLKMLEEVLPGSTELMPNGKRRLVTNP